MILIFYNTKNIKMDYSEFEFIVKLDDNNTLCKVKTYENNMMLLNFIYNKENYNIIIESNGNNIRRLVKKYITETNNNDYGFIDDENILNITVENKHQFKIKTAKDFMSCLNFLIEKHKSQLITYASYYYRNSKSETYSEYIQNKVCKFIKDENLLKKGIQFSLNKVPI